MPQGQIDKITKELASISAKLESQPAAGPRRLELLRRQATLGDLRDAELEAKRRASADRR
jgi:hypothetical protein